MCLYRCSGHLNMLLGKKKETPREFPGCLLSKSSDLQAQRKSGTIDSQIRMLQNGVIRSCAIIRFKCQRFSAVRLANSRMIVLTNTERQTRFFCGYIIQRMRIIFKPLEDIVGLACSLNLFHRHVEQLFDDRIMFTHWNHSSSAHSVVLIIM